MFPLLQSKVLLASSLPRSHLQQTMQSTCQHSSDLKARVGHLAALGTSLMA